MVDFSKYPNVKRIMDETGATIEEIYQVIEKLEGEDRHVQRGSPGQ